MTAGRGMVWTAGLLVALGAVAATAHGLFEVAVAARVPAGVAWLYPVITDGLALVAYAATARLAESARRYAWTVVVLAAGLSGLAQAVYLAGAVATAPAVLRFGIGAWPAVAAAVVAHLLYLIATPTAALAEETCSDDQPATAASLARTRQHPESRALPVTASESVPVPLPPAQPSTAADPVPVPLPDPALSPVRPAGDAGRRVRPGHAARRDQELLAVLARHSAPLSVRAAARELGCGVDRARRLLRQTGLLAGADGRSVGGPASADAAPDPASATETAWALHLVPDDPTPPRPAPPTRLDTPEDATTTEPADPQQ